MPAATARGQRPARDRRRPARRARGVAGGRGPVSVASPPDAVEVNAVELTAIMVKPFDGAEGLAAAGR